MKTKKPQPQKFYFYHSPVATGLQGETCGFCIADIRSIGHKWVYLKFGKNGRYRKLRRSKWNEITEQKYFMTLAEKQRRIDLSNECKRLGVAFYCTKKKKHKTTEQLQAEVDALTLRRCA